jgi:hypothetical protein
MKKASISAAARITAGTLFFLGSVALFCFIPIIGTRAQTSSSGGISASDTKAVTWDGTTISPGGVVNNESLCTDGVNCETFTLTVKGTKADWAGKRVQVLLTWQSSTNEYDLYIHKGSNSGALVTSAVAGPGLTRQVAYIDPAHSGTGVFTLHVAYDTTPASAADEYHGAVSAVPETPTPPPPAPQDTGPKIGYENFEAPGVLTQVSSTSSGGVTVEYMGRGAGEPSVGSDWKTGVANIQSDLETLFVTFNDSCPANGASSSWVNRRAPTSQFVDSDPIGFTDRDTGRVFAGELTLLSPQTVKISHTDDDGVTWVPDQSGGIASAVDHETIGGGVYHAPIPTGVSPLYPNAVYYCSQDIATALCSRSDDGGAHYGPSVPIYNLTACGGLHGHVKVSPKDGTVYVPNRDCAGQSAAVVSQDNGITWSVRPVQSAAVPNTSASDDPAIGIDSNGRVYFAFANNGTAAAVATSDDFGVTWHNIFNVSSVFGLKNIAFPAAVAGSAGRAAVAFYGSTTGVGDSNLGDFTGIWHLYVAHTFNGGATWTTSDLTPTLPMQRGGLLRGGDAYITRNLLDFFDVTIDRDGRVLVGYVNGCSGGNCAQAQPTAHGNTYSATASIARQSSGRRMLAGKDPASATSAPGMPFVTQRRVGTTVHLAWNEADIGNSPITAYRIFRGTTSGAEKASPIATVAGDGNTFDDVTATDNTKTYYYKVAAVNAVGESCDNNEVAAPFVGDTCSGMVIHKNEPSHPEATGGSVSQPPAPELLIDYIAVGEPPGTNELMFKMKVEDLSTIPPNSRWRIAWDWWTSVAVQQYYIGMTSDSTGTVSFEYGTLADAGVPAVLVLSETKLGNAAAGSNFKADGTITMFVPKSAVGNPKVGDLIGAIGGKTITGDTPTTNTFERSTAFVDHTFIKGQADNSFPPATYTVVGNGSCSARLLNIATRMRVLTDDNVEIAGFIVTGTEPKKVLIRGIGPSLAASIKAGSGPVLADPVLELHDDHNIIATNDNWKDVDQPQEVKDTGIAPTNDLESAILITLPPGHYTAVLRGKGSTTGIGVVEVYDLDSTADSQMANLSTRGFVETGDNVMIGGFIIGGGRGNGAAQVVVRAIGPSLSNANVPHPLQNPTLELHNNSGAIIATNDNWQTDPGAAKIQANKLAPTNQLESATFQTLPAGPYTAIVRDKDNTTGVGLVEVYNIP